MKTVLSDGKINKKQKLQNYRKKFEKTILMLNMEMIEIFGQKLHRETLIELVIPPYFPLNHLNTFLSDNKSIILDSSGEFFVEKNKHKVYLLRPSIKRILSICKYIDFDNFNILIINNLNSLFLSFEKSIISHFMNKLWNLIYKKKITVIFINRYEKIGKKLFPRIEKTLNIYISYRISVSTSFKSVKIQKFEAN